MQQGNVKEEDRAPTSLHNSRSCITTQNFNCWGLSPFREGGSNEPRAAPSVSSLTHTHAQMGFLFLQAHPWISCSRVSGIKFYKKEII